MSLILKDMKAMNKALLAKFTWRFINEDNSLAARWAKSKYGSNTIDISFKKGNSGLFIWRGIQKCGDLILNLLKWRIGNGSKIDISSSRWDLPWNGSPDIFVVSDLWDRDSATWSAGLLHGLYGNQDCSIIQHARPSILDLQDKLIWNGHNSGN